MVWLKTKVNGGSAQSNGKDETKGPMTELEKSQHLLADLVERKFFGTVSFQMKHGTIVLIRQESTVLPENLPPTTKRGPFNGNSNK